MNMEKGLSVWMAGLFAVTFAFEVSGAVSESFVAFLRPDESSFWRTAPGNSVTVPVDFPEGAETATLQVKGCGSGYSKTYQDITAESFSFSLPSATDTRSEDVYELTLTFDDESGTVRTARIGLIKGIGTDPSGRTRCVVPPGSRSWSKVDGTRAVLPIPYGATSLTVNGTEMDTGLGGAQGWYALTGLTSGNATELSLSADGETFYASLVSAAGLMFILR